MFYPDVAAAISGDLVIAVMRASKKGVSAVSGNRSPFLCDHKVQLFSSICRVATCTDTTRFLVLERKATIRLLDEALHRSEKCILFSILTASSCRSTFVA